MLVLCLLQHSLPEDALNLIRKGLSAVDSVEAIDVLEVLRSHFSPHLRYTASTNRSALLLAL